MVEQSELDEAWEEINNRKTKVKWIVIGATFYYAVLSLLFDYPLVGIWFTGLAGVVIYLLFHLVCVQALQTRLLSKIVVKHGDEEVSDQQ